MAYHSKRSKVYHNRKNCPVGKTIKRKRLISGTGGKKMCNFCKTSGTGKKGKKRTYRKGSRSWRKRLVIEVKNADSIVPDIPEVENKENE